MSTSATPVHIVNESGERLVVRTESSLERNVINERRELASWPADEPSQRMWALSAVMTAPGLRFRNDDDLDEKFAEAQRILDWVNGANPEVNAAGES